MVRTRPPFVSFAPRAHFSEARLMKVVATTSQSVLLVDCVTGQSSVLHRGAGLYYGIARIGSDLAVAARRRLVSSPVPREEERGCILRFGPDLRLRETL